jgi:hypothetical protein
VPDYRSGLTAAEALDLAEAALSRNDLGADQCHGLALQLGAHLDLHNVSSCLFSLARLLVDPGVTLRELEAAWGATLAAVRSEIEEREEVRHAA